MLRLLYSALQHAAAQAHRAHAPVGTRAANSTGTQLPRCELILPTLQTLTLQLHNYQTIAAFAGGYWILWLLFRRADARVFWSFTLTLLAAAGLEVAEVMRKGGSCRAQGSVPALAGPAAASAAGAPVAAGRSAATRCRLRSAGICAAAAPRGFLPGSHDRDPARGAIGSDRSARAQQGQGTPSRNPGPVRADVAARLGDDPWPASRRPGWGRASAPRRRRGLRVLASENCPGGHRANECPRACAAARRGASTRAETDPVGGRGLLRAELQVHGVRSALHPRDAASRGVPHICPRRDKRERWLRGCAHGPEGGVPALRARIGRSPRHDRRPVRVPVRQRSARHAGLERLDHGHQHAW